MSRNLFVAYDLINPGQNYEAVIAEIKKHGAWAKVEYSLFYLDPNETPVDVANAVRRVMDADDKLIVIEARDAAWNGLGEEVSKFLKSRWNSQAAA